VVVSDLEAEEPQLSHVMLGAGWACLDVTETIDKACRAAASTTDQHFVTVMLAIEALQKDRRLLGRCKIQDR
jgi:hypothetical protein